MIAIASPYFAVHPCTDLAEEVHQCTNPYCGAVFEDVDATCCVYCEQLRCPECGEDCCEDQEAERRAEEAMDLAVDFAREGYDD